MGLKSRWTDLGIETKIIKTQGDERHGDFDLVNVRTSCEGLFTGEIERALVAKRLIWLPTWFRKPHRPLSLWLSRQRLPFTRQCHRDLGAFAACAGNFQFAADLRDALAHAGETHAVMLIFNIEAIPVVLKLQTKLVRVAD
jgi:hypothetical protein